MAIKKNLKGLKKSKKYEEYEDDEDDFEEEDEEIAVPKKKSGKKPLVIEEDDEDDDEEPLDDLDEDEEEDEDDDEDEKPVVKKKASPAKKKVVEEDEDDDEEEEDDEDEEEEEEDEKPVVKKKSAPAKKAPVIEEEDDDEDDEEDEEEEEDDDVEEPKKPVKKAAPKKASNPTKKSSVKETPKKSAKKEVAKKESTSSNRLSEKEINAIIDARVIQYRKIQAARAAGETDKIPSAIRISMEEFYKILATKLVENPAWLKNMFTRLGYSWSTIDQEAIQFSLKDVANLMGIIRDVEFNILSRGSGYTLFNKENCHCSLEGYTTKEVIKDNRGLYKTLGITAKNAKVTHSKIPSFVKVSVKCPAPKIIRGGVDKKGKFVEIQ